MIEYRGYKIWTNTRTVSTRNPFSGYTWAYQIPTKGYYIAGPGAKVLQKFNKLQTAKEHVDFIIKFVTNGSVS
jgi:hypothetical protein